MILYSTNSIKNVKGETTNLEVSGPEQNELLVFDNSNENLLQNILKEIQITNLHLSMLSDNSIEKGDYE